MSLNQQQNSLSSWFCHGIMSAPNPQPAARTIFGAELRSAEVGEGCDAHRVVVTLAFGISSKDRDAEEMELQSNNKCHFLGCYLYYINAIYIYVYVYISCYHRSSVNIAFGVSRSELTKPGDQSMAGFDFINNTIKSGDRSMAGLDPIEVYISK